MVGFSRMPHTEPENRVGGDAVYLLVAVRHGGRDGENTLTTNLHTRDAFIPSLDDFTLTDLEIELGMTSQLIRLRRFA